MEAKNYFHIKACVKAAMRNKYIYIIFLILPIFLPVSAYSVNDQMIELSVNKGDYLIRICEKYLVQPKQCPQVIKINQLKNPDLIYPWQKLKIPIRLFKGVPTDGLVTFVKGDVTIKLREVIEWIPLQINDALKEGSYIKTGHESAVEIVFEDQTVLFIKEDTVISLTASRKSIFHFFNELFLEVGRAITKFRSATGEVNRFDIHTPSAVAAARGTEFRTSVGIDNTTRSEVLEGSIEVSAMKQRVVVSKGEGTLVKKGSPPMMPKKLLNPPDPVNIEYPYKYLPIRLKFSTIEDAVSYRISFSRDSKMKDIFKEGIIKPDGIFEIAGIPDGSYYLQSTSIDSDGIEGFPLEPIKVKVRINPLPPFISTPIDGLEHRKKTINFNWLKVMDADRYHLQVAKDRDFNNIVSDQVTKETEYLVSLDYRTYFFRIRSIAADDYEGGWSDIQRFNLLPPPPAPPIDKPALDEDKITIRWGNLGDGFAYHFQMSKDLEFNEILIDKNVETPFIVLKKPEEHGIYYVRTSSIDANKYEGDFSQPQSFEIKRSLQYKLLGVFGVLGIILLLTL